MIFKKYQISDICTIKYGKDHKKNSEGNIPVYGSGGLMRKCDNFLYEGASVLIPRKGTLNNIQYVEGKFWTVDTLFYTIINNEKVLPKYLFYKIKNINFCDMDTGSAVPSMTAQILNEIKIKIPSIENQNKTLNVLESIDSKLKENSETNNNLYDIASKLYDEKFNNCRNEEWDKYKLIDIANIVNGYSYNGAELVKDSSIGMATIKNFDRKGGFKEDGFKPLNPNKVKDSQYIQKFDVVVACTDLTQNADIIGKANLLLNKGIYEKIIISMDLVKIVPISDLVDNFMIYLILNSRDFKNFALGYTSGTTVLHLNKTCFKDYIIKLPAKVEIDNFIKKIKPIYIKISQIMEENKVLEQLRDTLLPKLMNGEIDLENVEI